MLDWLLSNVVVQFIVGVILILITPAVMAFSDRIKSMPRPQTLTYVLVSLAAGIFIFNQIPWKQSNPTPQEIENKIHQWAFDAGLKVHKINNIAGMCFNLELINPSGRPVTVSMCEKNKTSIKIGQGIEISEPLRELYDHLDDIDKQIVLKRLRIALIQQGVKLIESEGLFNKIEIFTDIPVYNLTDHEFWNAYHLIDSTIALVEQIVPLELDLINKKNVTNHQYFPYFVSSFNSQTLSVISAAMAGAARIVLGIQQKIPLPKMKS